MSYYVQDIKVPPWFEFRIKFLADEILTYLRLINPKLVESLPSDYQFLLAFPDGRGIQHIAGRYHVVPKINSPIVNNYIRLFRNRSWQYHKYNKSTAMMDHHIQ